MLIPGQSVHFVGIGGAGLSAIALVMLQQGYVVSGSDQRLNDLTAALQQEGARIYQGHEAEQVGTAELVIMSSAVPQDNVEVVAARERGIPVYKRDDILAELMDGYTAVAVAGTHGKTTTTAIIVHILAEAGFDPTYIVGGVVPSTGTNAGVGRGEVFVIEADEYDHMFLGLRPDIAVITNVELDHPDLYPTMSDLVHAFNQFAGLLDDEGLLVVCADDPVASALGYNRQVLRGPVASYGLHNPKADWLALDWQTNDDGGTNFTLRCRGDAGFQARVLLRVPGVHNVQNALAALVVVNHLGVPLASALAALATFAGAARRFDVRGTANGVTIIDDYAHHPTAIRATLAAARARFPRARIWAVWQPHTYSRLAALFDSFAGAFDPAHVDQVLVTDIYAAREQPGDGPGVPDLLEEMTYPNARHTPKLKDAANVLARELKSGDVLLILSAGDAPKIGEVLLRRLSEQEQLESW